VAPGKRKIAKGDVASNRQAAFRFNLLDRFEAGAVLRGTEVKALREGKAQLKDAYATVDDGEVWLHNMHIPPYKPAARENHEPERDRKLLLHRREIERLTGELSQKGLTLVPTRVYFRDGKAKVELALARGKDRFDKRASIRDRDMKRDVERQLRDAGR
jgi:SsrA-binding protein